MKSAPAHVVRPGRSLVRALVACCAAVIAVAGLPVAATAQEDEVAAARIAGGERFETAANIATETYDVTGVAVLAAGEDFPDALAASFAAGSVDGPVLLTGRDSLPPSTRQALDDLGVERVVLIRGTGPRSSPGSATPTTSRGPAVPSAWTAAAPCTTPTARATASATPGATPTASRDSRSPQPAGSMAVAGVASRTREV